MARVDEQGASDPLWYRKTAVPEYIADDRIWFWAMGTARIHDDTGGEHPFTQWVHGEFIMSTEAKCPTLTHQAHCSYFYNSPPNSPYINPVSTA